MAGVGNWKSSDWLVSSLLPDVGDLLVGVVCDLFFFKGVAHFKPTNCLVFCTVVTSRDTT